MTELCDSNREEITPVPRCSPAMLELAFIGFVLVVYFMILQFLTTLDQWGYRWVYLNMTPSLWLLGATLFWVKRYGGNSDYFHAGSKACRRAGIGIIIVSLIVCFFVEIFLSVISLSGDYMKEFQTVANLVILVPFAEEYFFRGLVLDHLVRNLGKFSGVMLVSVLFGFLHAPQGIFIQMFIFSLLLCLVTLKTKNVLASGTLHLGWNLFVFYHFFQKALLLWASPL